MKKRYTVTGGQARKKKVRALVRNVNEIYGPVPIAQLADLLDVNQSVLNRWITAKTLPRGGDSYDRVIAGLEQLIDGEEPTERRPLPKRRHDDMPVMSEPERAIFWGGLAVIAVTAAVASYLGML